MGDTITLTQPAEYHLDPTDPSLTEHKMRLTVSSEKTMTGTIEASQSADSAPSQEGQAIRYLGIVDECFGHTFSTAAVSGWTTNTLFGSGPNSAYSCTELSRIDATLKTAQGRNQSLYILPPGNVLVSRPLYLGHSGFPQDDVIGANIKQFSALSDALIKPFQGIDLTFAGIKEFVTKKLVVQASVVRVSENTRFDLDDDEAPSRNSCSTASSMVYSFQMPLGNSEGWEEAVYVDQNNQNSPACRGQNTLTLKKDKGRTELTIQYTDPKVSPFDGW